MQNNELKRDEWKSRLGPLLSLIGAAIGLGNIWRFPMSVYQNGGGAFLLPYFIALLTAGIPLMILEMGIGFKFKRAMPSSLKKIHPLGELLGWFSVLIPVVVMTFYSVIISWCLSFLYFVFSKEWGDSPETFLTNKFLNVSSGPFDFQGINLKIVFSLFLVWGITFFINKLGISKGIEKLSKIFTPLLIVMIIFMAVRSLFLDGAFGGISYFFKPSFEKLLDANLWLSAYTQVFFSANLAVGVIIAYSSYLPKDTDIVKISIQTVIANSFFDLVAGVLVFSVLGFLMLETGLSASQLVKNGPDIAFVAIPKLTTLMPGGPFVRQIFGALFFLSLIIAGISSLVSMVESFASSFIDKFNTNRIFLVGILVIIGFLGGTLFATNAGLYLIDIVNQYVGILGITVAAFLEIILFSYVSNIHEMKDFINGHARLKLNKVWIIIIKYVTPLILLISFIKMILDDNILRYGGYSLLANITFGLLLIILMIFFSILLSRLKGKD